MICLAGLVLWLYESAFLNQSHAPGTFGSTTYLRNQQGMVTKRNIYYPKVIWIITGSINVKIKW